MTIGLVGTNCGMTRIFKDDGSSIPVTVIEVDPNRVTQIKTTKSDGYSALQVTTGSRRLSRVNKAAIGHFRKASVEPGRGLWEFRVADDAQLANYSLGDTVAVDIFSSGDKVDVAAWSKGKGFAGTVKRHNFSMQDATHGNSRAHRAAGSIGQNQDPGKVFKGKKMAGQMGNKRVTVQALEVVRVLLEHNLILIKGSVPGSKGSNVIISSSVKSTNNGAQKDAG